MTDNIENYPYGEKLYNLHSAKHLQIRGAIKIDWRELDPYTKGVYDSISKDLIKEVLAPILDQSTELCYKIEESGCSEKLTECSILAAKLREDIDRLSN